MEKDDYVQYLMVLDHLNRTPFDTFRLLVDLHNAYSLINEVPSKLKSYYRLLLRLRITEVMCEYIELLGDYSVACKETGLLYPQRVLSIGPNEVARFYESSGNLTDDAIKLIFNPKNNLTPDELLDIRNKYARIFKFRSEIWSLYNAIKHGMRVYPLELAPKEKANGDVRNWYLSLQWVHVDQGRDAITQEQAHTWDGKEISLPIKKQEIRNDLFPSDDLKSYRSIMDDCHSLIEKILTRHAPDKAEPT